MKGRRARARSGCQQSLPPSIDRSVESAPSIAALGGSVRLREAATRTADFALRSAAHRLVCCFACISPSVCRRQQPQLSTACTPATTSGQRCWTLSHPPRFLPTSLLSFPFSCHHERLPLCTEAEEEVRGRGHGGRRGDFCVCCSLDSVIACNCAARGRPARLHCLLLRCLQLRLRVLPFVASRGGCNGRRSHAVAVRACLFLPDTLFVLVDLRIASCGRWHCRGSHEQGSAGAESTRKPSSKVRAMHRREAATEQRRSGCRTAPLTPRPHRHRSAALLSRFPWLLCSVVRPVRAVQRRVGPQPPSSPGAAAPDAALGGPPSSPMRPPDASHPPSAADASPPSAVRQGTGGAREWERELARCAREVQRATQELPASQRACEDSIRRCRQQGGQQCLLPIAPPLHLFCASTLPLLLLPLCSGVQQRLLCRASVEAAGQAGQIHSRCHCTQLAASLPWPPAHRRSAVVSCGPCRRAHRQRVLSSEARLRSLRRQLNDSLGAEWEAQQRRHEAAIDALLAVFGQPPVRRPSERPPHARHSSDAEQPSPSHSLDAHALTDGDEDTGLEGDDGEGGDADVTTVKDEGEEEKEVAIEGTGALQAVEAQ